MIKKNCLNNKCTGRNYHWILPFHLFDLNIYYEKKIPKQSDSD